MAKRAGYRHVQTMEKYFYRPRAIWSMRLTTALKLARAAKCSVERLCHEIDQRQIACGREAIFGDSAQTINQRFAN